MTPEADEAELDAVWVVLKANADLIDWHRRFNDDDHASREVRALLDIATALGFNPEEHVS